MNMRNDSTGSKYAAWIKPAIFIVAAAVLIAATRLLPITEWLRSFLSTVEDWGPLGPFILGGAYVIACMILVPGWILTLGAGLLFGVVEGSIIVSISSTIGATGAFLVGRYAARDIVARRIAGNAQFTALDQAIGRDGWKIIGLARLSPVVPFSILNYAFGLTRVSLKHFVLASWLGMLPGTVLFVYAGSVAGDLATIGRTDRERSNAEWALYGLGLLVTIVVTVILTRIAHRALKESMTDAQANGDDAAE